MKNLDRLMRKLDKLGGNTQKALVKGVGDATKLVVGDAKMLAPVAEVDGGGLQLSIQGEVYEDKDAIIGKTSTNLDYAPYVEFGTGQRGQESEHPPNMDLSFRQDWAGMEAQPYLYPAISQNREVIKEIIANELKKEIKKLGGG